MSLEDQVGPQVPKTFCGIPLPMILCPSGIPSVLWKLWERRNSHGIPPLSGRGHGLSLANETVARKDGSGVEPGCQSWIPLLKSWLLRNYGL